MYLLDTNIISELRKPPQRQHPALREWFINAPSPGMYLSALTIYELELDMRLMRRKDEIQGKRLEHWLHTVKMEFDGKIIPFSSEAATLAASWHVPKTASTIDSFIAATAAVSRLTLVTRDTKDFERFGIALINPFEPPTSGS